MAAYVHLHWQGIMYADNHRLVSAEELEVLELYSQHYTAASVVVVSIVREPLMMARLCTLLGQNYQSPPGFDLLEWIYDYTMRSAAT